MFVDDSRIVSEVFSVSPPAVIWTASGFATGLTVAQAYGEVVN